MVSTHEYMLPTPILKTQLGNASMQASNSSGTGAEEFRLKVNW